VTEKYEAVVGAADEQTIRAMTDPQTVGMDDTTLAKFHAGIRDNGTVEGHRVETHYAPTKAGGCNEDFLRIIIDVGETDIETRITYAALESMGLRRIVLS
jgi:hypothetical protein